jgi:predicted anti-sigma-YlaC factor YlaD
MLSCRKATELMSMQVEKKLPANKKLSLVFHVSMCKACRNFQKQMQILHEACQLLPENLFKK